MKRSRYQATQMMFGHDYAKEEPTGTQRLLATQLAPISRGAHILRPSFEGRARRWA
jgi:hypothetical protein